MGVDQRPGTPQPLPDIRYRRDLSVFEPAVTELRSQFSDERIKFGSLASYHGNVPVVEVVTPFVFDIRQFPSKHRGLWLLHHFSGAGYSFGADPTDAFSPQWMEDFVDSNEAQVRDQLGNPEMSREEILDALSAGIGFKTRGFADLRKEWESRHR